MSEPVTEPPGAQRSWRVPAVALSVDLLPCLAVVAATRLAALGFARYSAWWWVATVLCGVALAATAINRLLLPSLIGWSLGGALTGSTADRTGPRNIRVLVGAVFVAAAAVCTATALTSYLMVYRHDHAGDLARTELARQGPRIVAEMLSYEPNSLPEDFARAQSLATPKYREQLVPQQEAIRGGKPVPNLYRVTDGAVLNAAADRATMLLFLQGQRGQPGKERLISATVRVVFAKSARAWLVDDLTVVSKPFSEEEK